MRVVAFVTQKGGAGKTTLAACLAVVAAQAGENVIAVDLDPQQSLGKWGDERTVDALAVDRVDTPNFNQLPEIIQALERRGFSLAILDTAGMAGTATNLAMHVADLCVIPARPTRLDIQATWVTVEAVKRLRRDFAFVLNQCPPTPRSSRANEAAGGLQLLGVLAAPLVTQRADFQDAIAAGLGVTEYAPQGKAAEEVSGLWNWISRRTKENRYVETAVDYRIAQYR
jgi:chromosome partitioning protein